MANKPIETYGLHSQKNVWYHNQLDKDDGEIEKKITFVSVMNNTIDYIEEAVQIATTANYGRKSPDGKPGILHPLTVGLGGKTDDEIICGLLHNVMEVSDWTIEKLRARGFSENVLCTLVTLTYDKVTPYMDYVKGIAESGNPTAVAVKLNDFRHMLVMDRAGGREDLIKKHTEAFEYLQKAAGK